MTSLRRVVYGAVGLTLGVGLAAAVLVGLARSGSCEVHRHEPLSVDKLIAVRKRFDAYRDNPDEGIVVDDQELAMLIEDAADVPLYLHLDGEWVGGSIAFPAFGGGCWAVAFHGLLTVDDGRATFTPDALSVGALDLSLIFAGRPWVLQPEQMPSKRVAWFLQHTRHAEVHADQMEVDLMAPSTFRWR